MVIPNSIGFKPLSELMSNIIGPQFLVKPYFERDSVSVMFGDSGTLKSFVAIDLALCVAHGIDYHGKPVTQGAVFFLCGEGHGGISKRVAAWKKKHGIEDVDAPFFVSEIPAQILNDGNAEAIRYEIEKICHEIGQDPVLIVIDTLSTNFGKGDESLNPDIAEFLSKVVAEFRLPFKALILIIHHVGHSSKDRERGAYALRGNADSRILIEKLPNVGCSMKCKKMKETSDFDPVSFRYTQHILPGVFDSEGEQVTSLTLEMIPYEGGAEQKEISKRKSQAIAVLKEMSSANFDKGLRNGVTTTDWYKKLELLEIVTSHRNSKYKLKKNLLDDNLIRIEGKLVFPVDNPAD